MERKSRRSRVINNDFYDDLHEDWYACDNHPIALLRAENAVRVPWIIEIIQGKSRTVLDMGCGGGYLTNALSKEGHNVTGIDISKSSLMMASKHDGTGKVQYLHCSAYDVPCADVSFDVVCAMDILEHVEEPEKLIKEASRLLKPRGRLFFHTFNRNILSYLLVIKGVEWCVPNTPKNMHIYSLFITPSELKEYLAKHKMIVEDFRGFVPILTPVTLLKMLMTRRVPTNFSFTFSSRLTTGYSGYALKN